MNRASSACAIVSAFVLLAASACRDREAHEQAKPVAAAPADAAAPVAIAPADAAAVAAGDVAAPAAGDVAPPPAGGHDFIAEARALLRVGACGAGELPAGIDARMVDAHCKKVREVQERYTKRWVEPARAFFAAHVPRDLPSRVVYPFAGGDLSTALTVFPDADEITTISLEPAGDPRSLAALDRDHLRPALAQVEKELHFLYVVNFSNTLNLIDAMRGGKLPGQLVFSLSALHLHGFEPVALRFFRIEADGSLHYVDDQELATASAPGAATARKRNRFFSDMELQYRRPGESRVRVYRHIQADLSDSALKTDRGVIAHLEQKGKVAGMTKAAAYLLSWDSFSTIRRYLLDHVTWMVSDASGVPPDVSTQAGFVVETWGHFDGSHMPSGHGVERRWMNVWKAQPARALPFRFGYPDVRKQNHLVITRRAG